jgi:hypothetical protein
LILHQFFDEYPDEEDNQINMDELRINFGPFGNLLILEDKFIDNLSMSSSFPSIPMSIANLENTRCMQALSTTPTLLKL